MGANTEEQDPDQASVDANTEDGTLEEDVAPTPDDGGNDDPAIGEPGAYHKNGVSEVDPQNASNNENMVNEKVAANENLTNENMVNTNQTTSNQTNNTSSPRYLAYLDADDAAVNKKLAANENLKNGNVANRLLTTSNEPTNNPSNPILAYLDEDDVVEKEELRAIDVDPLQTEELPSQPPAATEGGGHLNNQGVREVGAYGVAPGEGAERRGDVDYGAVGNHPEEENTGSGGLSQAFLVEDMDVHDVEIQAVDPDAPRRRSTNAKDHEKKVQLLVAFVLCCAVVAIVLGVTFGVNKEPSPTPEDPPSSDNSTTLDLFLQDLPESTVTSISIMDTPQEQAYTWLANHPNVTSLSQWRMTQLFALVTFYYAFEGPSWPEDTKSTWLDYATNECFWITTPMELMMGLSYQYLQNTDIDFRQCNDAGEVQTIFLIYLQLSSDLKPFIPSELGLLSSLHILSLSYSGFGGRLATFLPPTQLSKLDLYILAGNAISGTIPAEFALFDNMRYLMVVDNQITGTIPTELGVMSNLKQFQTNWNQITGPIPTELGALTKLTFLGLESNEHTGKIPSEFGMMTDLTWMQLERNKLTGTIPSELGLMTSTTELDLDSNSFLSGPIPSELGMLLFVQRLQMSDNALTGSIPSELDYLVLTVNSSLELMTLAKNDLSGTLSDSLCLLQRYNESSEPATPGAESTEPRLGLSFDCNRQLCGCEWCLCDEYAMVEDNVNETTSEGPLMPMKASLSKEVEDESMTP